LERPRHGAIAKSAREAAQNKEKGMTNRKAKHQKGQIFLVRNKVGRTWYGRWRRDELETTADGSKVVVRRQHCEKLAEYSDTYRSKKDVRPLLDEKLRPLNEGRCAPESTLSVAEYTERFFLPWAKRELKPSTFCGYRGYWRGYLKARLEFDNIPLRDFRCVHATDALTEIHRQYEIGRTALRHCKALLSVIFSHAKRNGVLDGPNPITDAGLPRAAEASKPTHAYSADEVLLMLDALDGVARTAVALMYFCGLRPGEARAARWENYDGKTLRVCESMWRTKTSTPKTAESVASVPIAETLREILAESRRESGYILATATGAAVDLHNLAARGVRPTLALCAECKKEKKEHVANGHEFKPLPTWRGWYALRRGLATLATSIDTQMAAKSLLRHANVATTQQFYIKSVPAEALRAVEKMDALFQKSGANSVPN
jgi:integrase